MRQTVMQRFVQAGAGIYGKILQNRIRPSDTRRNSALILQKTNWESATVTTLDDKIIPYIMDICKRDPRSGKVVTGGIVVPGFQLAVKLDDQPSGTVQRAG